MTRYLTFVSVALLTTLQACAGGHDRVNGSVSVGAGEKAGNLSTVNGAVHVGDNATVGSASTVNGGIELGTKVTAASLKTVNGGISIAGNAQVSGDVSTVNGAVSLGKSARVASAISTVNGGVTLDSGADVAGHVHNVNGRIQLTAAHVGGGIKTNVGDIEIGAGSRVKGGILVEKSASFGFSWGKEKVPRIVIGPDAVVQGPLKFERKVALYVSDSATIGPVEGAEIVKFAGDRAPD